MSHSSDSDEYYDAEDITPNKSRKLNPLSPTKSESELAAKSEEKKVEPGPPSSLALTSTVDSNKFFERSQTNRNKLKELRHRIQTEDEEVGQPGTSPASSQTSSFDGVFPGPDTRSCHPFRIIEHDALSLHSLTSLGRVGRILGTGPDPVSQNLTKELSSNSLGGSTTTLKSPSEAKEFVKEGESKLQEPDVIASTKAGGSAQLQSSAPVSTSATTGVETLPAPVAPPRRRKKPKGPPVPPNTLPLQKEDPPKLTKSASAEDGYKSATLPSPGTTIESITREFEHCLDIKAATKGQYVVKPQESGENKSRSVRSSGRISSTYPLPSGTIGAPTGSGRRERRKSAGDEQALLPNMFVRTRTDSGKPLSDLEILEQVTVLNLDTGERVPLSIAEDKLPQCINPLSLHIMRLTSEYVSNTSLEKAQRESDEDSVISKRSRRSGVDGEVEGGVVKRKTAQFKKFFGSTVKKTMFKAKAIGRHAKEETVEVVDDPASTATGEQYIKLKASNSHKGPYEFDCVQLVQDLSGVHTGPVWCMKFSTCGRLLATAGQDRVLRVWVVRSAYHYFQEVRTKYNAKVSPTPSQESIVEVSVEDPNWNNSDDSDTEQDEKTPFMPKPFCTYSGHTSDLLDVSWSKNYFILSSSMDKTVRLWHISRKECLCCFQHIDFVTAIVFHPRDDRYFLSGSLDGKLRLWDIPDKKVALWQEIDGPAKLITAANFCQNGKFAVVGSYDGRVIFYTTELKYYTQIDVRSSRGKNKTGRKISGVEPMPGADKILITSNDSRIRLYDLRDLNVTCKYKGFANFSSQIKASFSHDGKFIVSGSENQCIYVWKSDHDYTKFSSVRRDRNDYWEGIKAHNAVVTCAVFSPNPSVIMRQMDEFEGNPEAGTTGYVLVSADFNGCIKVFINKTKPKHSSLPASALA